MTHFHCYFQQSSNKKVMDTLLKQVEDALKEHNQEYQLELLADSAAAYYSAKKLARTLPDQANAQKDVALFIGSAAFLNRGLNGLLSHERQFAIPFAPVLKNTTNLHATDELLEAIGNILGRQEAQMAWIGKIKGDIPQEGAAYFYQDLAFGSDIRPFHTVQPKIKHPHLSRLQQAFLALFHQDREDSFPVTVHWNKQYRSFPKVAGIRAENNPKQNGIEIRLLESLGSYKLFLSILHLHPREDLGYQDFTIQKGCHLHIGDIVPAEIDAYKLGRGAYSFHIEQEEYPLWQ
ncbi:hypothetical protein [Eupransor demetentiae]|uniref:Diacylglycerol kinase family (LCB5) n=1 Tax=Eupransor demetentiae TaxID=3109584 RepID=A0ABM9N389_9LACO|nr:Phosphatidylglycerol kinase [Lactobacillaceae bacterium LMG 33000]